MISLTELLTNILDTFFNLKATRALGFEGENAISATLEKAKPIQLKLKDWHSKSPPSLAVGSLHLAYFAVEITLHRAIIRFDSTNLNDNLRYVTRSAAKMRFTSAIDLVSKLEPANLQSFWYFASKVNLAVIGTFGSLLWATSDNPEEADFYRSQLAEYRWTLRMSSKSGEFMKFAVGLLDSSAVFLKENSSKTTSPTVARDEPANGEIEQEVTEEIQNIEHHTDHSIQNFNPAFYGTEDVSPSVGNSTENAYSYNQFFTSKATNMVDTRPSSSVLANNFSFISGDFQDWSLDQPYNFETFPLVGDILGKEGFVEEFDDSGNIFAGF